MYIQRLARTGDENEWADVLSDRVTHTSIIHHISKKDHYIGMQRLCSAPALAHVEVDDLLAQPNEPWMSSWIRMCVEDLWVCDK